MFDKNEIFYVCFISVKSQINLEYLKYYITRGHETEIKSPTIDTVIMDSNYATNDTKDTYKTDTKEFMHV